MNKIVRIVHFFGKMDRGGAETFIMNVYRKINRDIMQFDFIVTSDESGSYDEEIKQLGGTIYRLPSPSRGLISYTKALTKVLNQTDYDVAHSHVHHFSGINLFIAKRCGIRKRIAHSHTTSDGKKGSVIRESYKNFMSFLIRKNSTCMLSCSREACESLYGKSISGKSILINNGIDLDLFINNLTTKEAMRKVLGIPEEAFVIGHVGRFQLVKNHEYIIDIFNYVQLKKDDAYLILVGSGELREKIEEKVKYLGIESKVKFLGERSDIHDILKCLDIFLFPSFYEGLGIALIEAQASQLRCIASSNVPREVNLTNLVEFIDLDEDLEEWCKAICSSKGVKINMNKLDDYDINKVTKVLEDIYTRSGE